MIAAALLVAQALAPSPPAATAPACGYDRAAMLALDERAFDQDMTGGWRALSNRGCELAAADLIRTYREAHGASRMTFLSHWHEGQLRAEAGQTQAAIALFARARKTPELDNGFGWNLYVDGSIAFLRRTRPALQAARDHLAALPPPAGLPATVRWPMNLNVLDGLLRCFDKDYRTAYGVTCSRPAVVITAP